jgi:hypothetical protein
MARKHRRDEPEADTSMSISSEELRLGTRSGYDWDTVAGPFLLIQHSKVSLYEHASNLISIDWMQIAIA